MSRRATIYPHNRLRNVSLSVGEIRSENGAHLENVERLDAESYGATRVILTDAKPAWDQLEISVGFQIESADLQHVLPNARRADRDAIGLVSVWCPSTKVRYGAGLEMEAPGRWSGQVRIARSDIAGVVHLRPLLVRAREAGARPTAADFATEARAILGEGAPVELVFDRSAAAFHSDFAYHWVHFSKSENTWLKTRAADAFYCSLEETPAIYLNLDLPSLQPILNSKSLVSASAALRETYAAVIGQDTFTQLLVTSVLSIRQNDDQCVVDGPQWRTDFAKNLGGHLFPELTEDEQLRQLYEQVSDSGSVGTLIAQIGSIAQDLCRTGRRLSRAASAMRMTDNEEQGEAE